MLDTESEPKTVLIYIILISLLERTGINFKIRHLIPLGILRIPNKSQEYLRLYYFKTPLPNSTPKSSNIKPSTFIYSNLLN